MPRRSRLCAHRLAQFSREGSDFTQRVEADLAFHLLLCELAENPMLVESWRHLEGRIRVAIMSHDASQLPGIMADDRHATIVDAIEQGDARRGAPRRGGPHGSGRRALRRTVTRLP